MYSPKWRTAYADFFLRRAPELLAPLYRRLRSRFDERSYDVVLDLGCARFASANSALVDVRATSDGRGSRIQPVGAASASFLRSFRKDLALRPFPKFHVDAWSPRAFAVSQLAQPPLFVNGRLIHDSAELSGCLQRVV